VAFVVCIGILLLGMRELLQGSILNIT